MLKVLAVGLALIAQADEENSSDLSTPYLMPEVVITATRLSMPADASPWPVDVIEVEADETTDLGDALASSPSSDVRSYGGEGHSSFSFLGGVSASRVLVLYDGIHMNSRRDGVIDLSLIPMMPGDRVEVVKGPLSALYGSSAIGGVVNVIPSRSDGISANVKATDRLGLGAGVRGGYNWGILGVRASGSYLTNPGFRRNDDVNRFSAGSSIWLDPNPRRSIELAGSYVWREMGVPGPVPDTADSAFVLPEYGDSTVTSLYNRQRDNLATLKFENVYRPTETYYHALNLYVINHDFTYNWRYTAISDGEEFTEAVRSNFDDLRIGCDIQAVTMPGEKVTLTGGLFVESEILHQLDYRTNAETDTVTWQWTNETRASHLGTWAEFLAQFGIVIPSAALRLEYSDDYGSFFSPELGVSITPWGGRLKFSAAYGRSFQAPTLNDLFWPADQYSQGNPDLVPEKAHTVTLSAQTRPLEFLDVSVAGSWKDIDNMIAWLPYQGGVWRPDNVDKVVIWGGEFSSRWSIFDDLFSGSVGIAYNHATETRTIVTYDDSWGTGEFDVDTVSRQAAFVPPLILKGDISLRAWPGGSLNAVASWNDARVNYYPDYSPYPQVDVIEDTLDPAFKLDASVSQKLFKLLTVEVGVRNILDDRTPAHFGGVADLDYPTAPRRFYGSVSVNTNFRD